MTIEAPEGYELLPVDAIPKKGDLVDRCGDWVLVTKDWTYWRNLPVVRRIKTPDVEELSAEVHWLKAEVEAYRNLNGNPYRNYVDECNELLKAKDDELERLKAEIERLKAQQSNPQWIPVPPAPGGRWPTEEDAPQGRVYVQSKSGATWIVKVHYVDYEDIVAWMQLPDPYVPQQTQPKPVDPDAAMELVQWLEKHVSTCEEGLMSYQQAELRDLLVRCRKHDGERD